MTNFKLFSQPCALFPRGKLIQIIFVHIHANVIGQSKALTIFSFYGLRVEIKIVLFYAVILLGLGKKYLQSLTSGTFLPAALPIRQ